MLAEVVGFGLLLGWLVWKYPELVDSIIPWVALLILWHLTWEYALDNRPVRHGATFVARKVNALVAWPSVFLLGGAISMLYWYGINRGMSQLSQIAAARTAAKAQPETRSSPTRTGLQPPSNPEPSPDRPSLPAPTQPLKSVLVMKAFSIQVGANKPDNPYSRADLDIANPEDDAVQNVDVVISTVPPKTITGAEKIPRDADCKLYTINDTPDMRVRFFGENGASHLTISARDVFADRPRIGRWRLSCPRLSSNSSLRIQLTIAGDVDSLKVSGSYELIPSRGSILVKVDETVPIA